MVLSYDVFGFVCWGMSHVIVSIFCYICYLPFPKDTHFCKPFRTLVLQKLFDP